MKNFLFSLLFICSQLQGQAQSSEAPYRIFGEISTVENKTYEGFITWAGTKNYWIDFFEGSKPTNPYSRYFNEEEGVYFHNNGRSSTQPPVHVFSCRFGNIASIRPTADNQAEVELKNGDKILVVKGNTPDINASVLIANDSNTLRLRWDYISEVRFREAPATLTPPAVSQVAGIVKSSQGFYKGLITWNYTPTMNAERFNRDNAILQKVKSIGRPKGNRPMPLLEIIPANKYSKETVRTNVAMRAPLENVMVNMPNVGSVIVAANRFIQMDLIPISELNLLSYNAFHAPETLKGTVTTRNNEKITGLLAYDLDEDLNVESLDGKNNNITYRIPFRYIRSIEPKNYKYSFITLRNGSTLSLGEAPDVNQENSGIIVRDDEDIPVYILWDEVKSVQIE